MAGVFGSISAKDLLSKLGRDLDAVRRSLNDVDSAFNFFVTAEHMLDWLYPGSMKRKVREDARKGDVCCSSCRTSQMARNMVLDADAAKAFGDRISALELAERTYAYWSEPGRMK